MSKGNKVKTLRIYPILEHVINETITRRNLHSRRAPWDFSKFCLDAIWEKVRKMERSRRPRSSRRRKTAVAPSADFPNANTLEDANANA